MGKVILHIFKITALLLMLFSNAAQATEIHLTIEQQRVLLLAFKEGKRFGFERTMQSLAFAETVAGRYNIGDTDQKVGERAYGVAQIKLSTARQVLTKHRLFRKHPKYGRLKYDEQLITALMSDEEFNVRMAAYHLHELYLKFKKDGEPNKRALDLAIKAYNCGLNRICANGEYLKRVKLFRNTLIKEFNKRVAAGEINPDNLADIKFVYEDGKPAVLNSASPASPTSPANPASPASPK